LLELHTKTFNVSWVCERSYYRYLQDCFKEDRERLAQSVTADEILTQTAIAEARLTDMYRNLREIAKNEKLEPSDRISAEQTAGEVSAVIHRLWTEAPTAAINHANRQLPHIQRILAKQIQTSLDTDPRIEYLLKKEKERQQRKEGF
jgi:hypothetical protein